MGGCSNGLVCRCRGAIPAPSHHSPGGEVQTYHRRFQQALLEEGGAPRGHTGPIAALHGVEASAPCQPRDARLSAGGDAARHGAAWRVKTFRAAGGHARALPGFSAQQHFLRGAVSPEAPSRDQGPSHT